MRSGSYYTNTAHMVTCVSTGSSSHSDTVSTRSALPHATQLLLLLPSAEHLDWCPQVIQVCQAVNRNLCIFRARFSALIPRELQRALQQLVQPNAADSAAVDARQEIDLRIGASFTRFQTLLLQVKPNWGEWHVSHHC